MSKMSQSVKEKKEKKGRVENFMGGYSYEVNPLDTLKMVTASSIFGEPQYYREGEFGEINVKDGSYCIHNLFEKYSIIDDKYSVVGFPALIPGINPPFFLIFTDTSAGLNVAKV